METKPGIIALIGSGETSSAGGKIYEELAKQAPVPLHASVIETPAGFELNSNVVAGRVADYLRTHLQNYQTTVDLIPARKKGTPFSPDNPEVVSPLFESDLIFMGPGSPSYAARQLLESLGWEIIRARHRTGASLAFASAAAIACGKLVLPVYEIFKAGEDPHWKPGLDFLAPYGLNLLIIPHWNNSEGGPGLDTSRCFIGLARFEELLQQAPAEAVVVGLDEHTGLVINLADQSCHVLGRGKIHILSQGQEREFSGGTGFPIQILGKYTPLDDPAEGISMEIFQKSLARLQHPQQFDAPAVLPSEVKTLSEQRQAARSNQNWAEADRLRQALTDLGWTVQDTAQGQKLNQISPKT
jgi:hypothetical protein